MSSTPSFIALVPGGGYWDISPGKVVTLPGLGTGYTWRNPVPSTVDLVLVGGDNRGMGSGGFISSTVSPGDPSRDSSGNCLTTGATTSNSSSSSSVVNVGAIAGGVIGGVIFLGLVLFILRLLHQIKKLKSRLVDPDVQTQTAAVADTLSRPYYDGSATYEPLYGQPISAPVPRQPSQNHEEPSRLVDVASRSEREGQPPAYTNQSESTPAVTTVPVASSLKQQRTPLNGPATQTSVGQENDPIHLTWGGR